VIGMHFAVVRLQTVSAKLSGLPSAFGIEFGGIVCHRSKWLPPTMTWDSV